MKYLANIIKKSQRSYRKKLLEKVQHLNRDVNSVAEKNLGLLHRCVFDLPHGLVASIGGHDDAVADLGLSYMKAIKSWVFTGKNGSVGTYIGNGIRWGACALAKEKHVITVPTPCNIALLTRQAMKTRATKCNNIRHFHGSEGRRQDAALLVNDKDDLYQGEIEEMLDAAMRFVRPRLVMAARCRMSGMTYDEMAAHMGCSRERARQMVVQANQRLKDALRNLYPNIGDMI